MWRNTTVRDFTAWLHDHNTQCRNDGRREAGFFYGLDLYSLHRSMQEVIDYLTTSTRSRRSGRESATPASITPAETTVRHTGTPPRSVRGGCPARRRLSSNWSNCSARGLQYARRDGLLAEDELFYAQQNAQTVRNAEVYYRSMFGSRVSSWNLRDQHMFQTLRALRAHLHQRNGEPARIVVWAHNSHVGDARATEVGADGQLTLGGQLVREGGYGEQALLIGFTTYSGTVTAASEWGGAWPSGRWFAPALNGSVEELLHEVDRPEFLVSPLISREAAGPLDTVRLGRAIGVIYQPATERQSHYYHVRPGEQFDAIIHIDRTTALEPLELNSVWVAAQTPETYPDRPVSAPPVIVTVTMNPALDITVDAERVGPTDKVRCCADRYDAGGGGLNVARFARALGAPRLRRAHGGRPDRSAPGRAPRRRIVPNTFIALRGDTRESFTVNERSTGRQYRFVLPGPVLTTDEQQRCLEVIDASATGAAFVVASGSLPPGVPADFYQRIADICRTRQVRLVLDTSGGGLEHITSGVFLLKPSVRELRECVGSPLVTEGEQIAAARHLIDRGVAEVIVVSLGADGALLVTGGDRCRRLAPVAVPTVSGVGAGGTRWSPA